MITLRFSAAPAGSATPAGPTTIAIAGQQDEAVTAHLLRAVAVRAGFTVDEAHAGNADVVILHPDHGAEPPDLPSTAALLLDTDSFDADSLSAAGYGARAVRGFGLAAAAELRADDLDATAGGTTFVLVIDGQSHQVRLRLLGERVVLSVLAAIAAAQELGLGLADVISTLEQLDGVGRHHMEVLRSPEGVTVINDAASASPDSMASSLKTLAQITRSGPRSVAVLGELTNLGEDARDEHDRIGRLVVRLNIRKLVVVGHAARHIHNAAGLEGSWDGESVLTNSAEEAYDLLREELREGDVVLVKSSGADGLAELGDRIGGRIA